VREPDGLALSSRNAQLSPDERRAATVLYRALAAGRDAIAAGERRADAVRRRMREVLAGEPLAHVEYAEAVDADSFWPLDLLRGRLVLPLAARIGAVRLIDNLAIDLGA
jgi:pantoate--beta-alanine ligase